MQVASIKDLTLCDSILSIVPPSFYLRDPSTCEDASNATLCFCIVDIKDEAQDPLQVSKLKTCASCQPKLHVHDQKP